VEPKSQSELNEFARQTAGVILGALYHSHVMTYVASYFEGAKQEGQLDEAKKLFLNHFYDLMDVQTGCGIQRHQQMSNYLGSIVLQIQDQVGKVLSGEITEACVKTLDSLAETRTILHRASSQIFNSIDKAVIQDAVDHWRERKLKETMVGELKSRLSGYGECPCAGHEEPDPELEKKNLH
jgi:hypothetical protein